LILFYHKDYGLRIETGREGDGVRGRQGDKERGEMGRIRAVRARD